MRKVLSLILILCLLLSALTGCDAFSVGAKKLTIMMYVVGSNLESGISGIGGGSASKDFREILDSKVDLNKVNILIYTGGASSWKNGIPATVSNLFQIVRHNGRKELVKLTDTGVKANMGSPAQLSNLLNYGYQNYPAQAYSLICWNHGGGPAQGFGYDENFNDMLSLSEMVQAFENSPFKGENKLSWIGFDACLMGSLEIGDALKNYANYLIASEETEPGSGWDYSFLSDIGSDYGAENIAKACIDRYCQYDAVSALSEFGSYASMLFMNKPSLTLSCVNLQKTDALTGAVDALFSAMNRSLSSGNIQQLTQARRSLYVFGSDSITEKVDELDLVDLGDLANASSALYAAEAQAVKDALNEYVVYHNGDVSSAGGVSIYYPYMGLNTFYDYGSSSFTNFTSSPGYVEYVRNYTDMLYKSILSVSGKYTRSNAPLKNAAAGKDKVTVRLTEEQQKTFSRAYVNVLQKIEQQSKYTNNDYVGLLLGYEVEPDENGVISFDSDIAVPVTPDSSDGDSFWPMKQVSSSNGVKTYKTLRTVVIAAPEEMPMTAWRLISVNARQRQDSSDLEIFGVNYIDEDGTPQGKSTVETDNWNYFENISNSKMLKYEDDGSLKPYSEWESGGTMLMRYCEFNEDLNVVMKPLSQCDYGEYGYQVVIEDVNGNQQASDLFRFQMGEQYETVNTRTAGGGELVYRVYSDHAEAKSYSGEDELLTIPAVFKGLPVTRLHRNFVEYGTKLGELRIESPDIQLDYECLFGIKAHKITLPEGLTKIPGKAFYQAEIEEINIPSTVETIERWAFANCARLKELKLPSGVKTIREGAFSCAMADKGISFDGDNPNYKIENDMLLSKDGKILFGRFSKSNDCIVPEGVEEIASWGCTGCDRYLPDENYQNTGVDNTVKSVTLPESLRIIRSDAFRNCALTELTIPDNVVYIGHNAFSNFALAYDDPNNTYSDEEPPEHVSLTIGSSLEWLGQDVLGYNSPRQVVVSEDNPYFSASGDQLMNKAGDHEIPLVKKTETALKRETEYKALTYARGQLDLSAYQPQSDYDEYVYDGETYHQTWVLPEYGKQANISSNFVLDGQKYTMPCKLSDLLDAGLRYNNPNDKDELIKPDETMILYLENASSQKLEAHIRNKTDDKAAPSACTIEQLTVNAAANNGVADCSFSGVNANITMKEAAEKLGSPGLISVFYYDKTAAMIRLEYKNEQKLDDGLQTDTLSITFVYDVEKNVEKGSSVALQYYRYVSGF